MADIKNIDFTLQKKLAGFLLFFGILVASAVGFLTVNGMALFFAAAAVLSLVGSLVLAKSALGDISQPSGEELNVESVRLQAALDNAESNIMLLNSEKEITYMNKAMSAFLLERTAELSKQLPNFDASELIGSPISRVHQKFDISFQDLVNAQLEIGLCSFRTSIKPLRDHDGEHIGAIVQWQDITDEVADSLEEIRNRRVKQALDVCQANVMLADNDLKIVYANDSVVEMLQARADILNAEIPKLDIDNLVGVCVDDFHTDPSHQRAMISKLSEVYKTQISVGGLTFGLIATPMFDGQGERIGTVVEWDDRTDMLAAQEKEKAIADTNARVKQALDQCQANVMLADNDLNIIYCNESANSMMSSRQDVLKEHISGFDASNLVGSCVDDFHKQPEHQREMIASMSEVYKTRLALGDLSFDLILTPLFNDEGSRLGTVVEWTDMTDILLQESHLRVIADENARIRQALDSASSNVMLADENNVITYMNKTVSEMFVEAESDIKQDLPAFEARALVGKSMDVFHKNPGHQQHVIANLTSTIESEATVGGRTYAITTTPLIGEGGKRLGTVVEWLDRTLALSIEAGVLGEVQETVQAALVGNLNQRIDLSGKEGFYATLSTSINELLTLFDHVIEEVLLVSGKLAEGDLTRSVEGEFKGTFGEVKDQMNATIVGLTSVMESIKAAAETVSAGAEEISQGNTNLSQRTEEQASSLEETASSMEEMTSTVQQNAENARDADRLALDAREKAEHGGKIVGNAVVAMSEINSASKRIADIISVIDEIAFQTNLLALNASVEAARAGEQGRGFAVVASEVRNLAGRSATAAKEIKELIEDSVNKVNEGSKLVDESGKTLEEIIAEVQKVTNVVGEISAASAEQASGIEEVNKAITQMDEMTQQNAALVEEAAAASEVMGQQSGDLKAQVAYFKTSTSRSASSQFTASSASPSAEASSPAKLTAVSGRAPARSPKPVSAPRDIAPAKPALVAGIGGTDWEEF